MVLSGKFVDDVIAQAAGTKDLGEERAEKQAEEKESLDLRRVLRICCREHGDDGEDPPVPGKAVGQNPHDHDGVSEC